MGIEINISPEEYAKFVQEQQQHLLGIMDDPMFASFFEPEFLEEMKKELTPPTDKE